MTRLRVNSNGYRFGLMLVLPGPLCMGPPKSLNCVVELINIKVTVSNLPVSLAASSPS